MVGILGGGGYDNAPATKCQVGHWAAPSRHLSLLRTVILHSKCSFLETALLVSAFVCICQRSYCASPVLFSALAILAFLFFVAARVQ